MNKKAGTFFSTIVKIIMVLILVMIIAQFMGVNLWTLAKSGLGLTEEIIPINYTQMNNLAKDAFERTIKDIEDCKNSKDKTCGCSIDLEGYHKTHALWFENNKIKLLNIKNIEGNTIEKLRRGQGTVIDYHTINNINCFLKKGFKEEEFELIYFYKNKEPHIFKDRLYTGALTGYRGSAYQILEKYQLYKTETGKLCWLTNKLKEDEINKIKKCS